MAKQQKYHGNSCLQVPTSKKLGRSASLDEDCSAASGNDQESVIWKRHTHSKLTRSVTMDSGIDVTKDLSTIGSPENYTPLSSDNEEDNEINERPTEVQIPFIKPVQVFKIDSSGATLTGFNEIIIDIPPNAISHDYDINKAHLEVGVCLYGPFQFQEKSRLISPILRLCMQEKGIVLNKPIKVTLPHILTELSNEKLEAFGIGFAKAKHEYITNKSGSRVHVFEPSTDDASYFFSGGKAYGVLQTTHFCYLCLQVKMDCQVAYNAGYCLRRVHQPSTKSLCFYVTYFLDTCLEALKKQLRDNQNADDGGSCSSDVATHRFKLVNNDDLQLSCNPREAVAMEPANGVIRVADIDFWDKTLAEMEREHKHNIYPPRVKMAVINPQLLQQLNIKFCNGNKELEDLEVEIPLDSIINNAGPGLPSSDASFTRLKQSAGSNDESDFCQLDTVAKPTITKFWELSKRIHEDLKIDGDGVTVAILDSSININHKAFANVKLDGKNFIAEKRDDFWCTNREPHGTMVAGIVAKIAPKAKIYLCCVAEDKEYKREAVIQALTELAETRYADIVVMSFGCRRCMDEEKARANGDEKIKYKLERSKLIDKLVEKGVICVAAVGNQGLYGPGIASPACLSNVLAVGALNRQGYPSELNNPGKDQIDVYAPGENISAPTSFDNKNYQIVSGTSCAAPAVAGIVALLLQCASSADIHINNIETLKKIFRHMNKEIDDTEVLCPVEFFEKHGKNFEAFLKMKIT